MYLIPLIGKDLYKYIPLPPPVQCIEYLPVRAVEVVTEQSPCLAHDFAKPFVPISSKEGLSITLASFTKAISDNKDTTNICNY
jgi:hypothetical protein